MGNWLWFYYSIFLLSFSSIVESSSTFFNSCSQFFSRKTKFSFIFGLNFLITSSSSNSSTGQMYFSSKRNKVWMDLKFSVCVCRKWKREDNHFFLQPSHHMGQIQVDFHPWKIFPLQYFSMSIKNVEPWFYCLNQTPYVDAWNHIIWCHLWEGNFGHTVAEKS